MSTTSSDTSTDGRVVSARLQRAKNLFDFLARAQQLRTAVTRDVENYDTTIWFSTLPHHAAVRAAHRSPAAEADEPLLVVERVQRFDPPAPDADLARWIAGDLTKPATEPTLRERVLEPSAPHSGDATATYELLADHPDLPLRFDAWLATWRAWAKRDVADAEVRTLYRELFALHVSSSTRPEEFELVLGVGCLTWKPAAHVHEPVRRHVMTFPISVAFDEDSGRLTVGRVLDAPHPVAVELEMLAPGVITNVAAVTAAQEAARDYDDHPADLGAVAVPLRRITNALHSDATYSDAVALPEGTAFPVVAVAPAVILRKRSSQGLVDIFQTIRRQLDDAEDVPDGLIPLVDPDHQPASTPDTTPGAIVVDGDESFLPLPVNERQMRVLESVDARAQTVVQGPPGTGKTHTAAALLSHLLAQGKRVLVAAQTDRALHEVRGKLPPEIRPLSVSVVGSSSADMADLKVAVERISTAAADYDAPASQRAIDRQLDQIDSLRRERAGLYDALLRSREADVAHHTVGNGSGTLAELALGYQAGADRHRWLTDLGEVTAGSTSPVADIDALAWLRLLTDPQLRADEAEARSRLLDLSELLDDATFAGLVDQERAARESAVTHAEVAAHAQYGAVRALSAAGRGALREQMRRVVAEATALEQRHERWIPAAVFDVRAGRGTSWRDRAGQVRSLLAAAQPLVAGLDPLVEVEIRSGEPAVLMRLAEGIRNHLAGGATIKTNPDGSPKLGLLASRVVKESTALFDGVRVGGLPPTTARQLDLFLTWAHALRTIDGLDRAWSAVDVAPGAGSPRERLAWHATELEQLDRVLDLGEELSSAEGRLRASGIEPPAWTDLSSVLTYAALVDAAAAHETWSAATAPLQELEAELGRWIAQPGASTTAHRLVDAVRERDTAAYSTDRARMVALHEARSTLTRRDDLQRALERGAPALVRAVASDPADARWPERLGELEASWGWAATGAWIREQESADVNVLQAQIAAVESQIRKTVERLAAERAWAHAVDPRRLSGRARADLAQYAQLMRRLGKGTGKYAAQQRTDIRHAMQRCRGAVPVWIMPIYRIAEQFSVEENMFDVVIVDEASQAGLEATFLQYLAPKIVVIGDDRQVSPSAVGVDQQELRDLADQFLAGDDHRATWQDPKRSLFDEAQMRFGGKITLTEHRRCVPEIIQFSNRIAYEPDGIRLVPVRLVGAERLDPIKVVHCADGYMTGGSTRRINPVEVEAIVQQVLACAADPRYDGATFGVISLLGSHQARAIEAALLDKMPPEEWAARDLRCGDAADFQGSERDVVFLSMVAVAEPGKRLAALTQEMHVQRYNVAVSRAKDQLWLFHSVPLNALTNAEDMRHQLVEYCYAVAQRSMTEVAGAVTLVPENERVSPFDSLFEQRVHNRIVDRGLTVVPQYEVEGYHLDLVVVGSRGRVAVECDGDYWHGPDAYAADLARQRELERCGWTFFRVRESAFYLDPAGALAGLWALLEEQGITAWSPDEVTSLDEVIVVGDVGADVGEPEPEWEPEPSHEPVSERSPLPEIQGDRLSAPAGQAARPLAVAAAMTYVAVPKRRPLSAMETSDELVATVVDIVTVEGPVTGGRLQAALAGASGSAGVPRQTAHVINKAVTRAISHDLIVKDDPLGEGGVKPATFRLSSQPTAIVREAGPRSFDDVPPAEVAAVMDAFAETEGWADLRAVYRHVAEHYRLGRLSEAEALRMHQIASALRP